MTSKGYKRSKTKVGKVECYCRDCGELFRSAGGQKGREDAAEIARYHSQLFDHTVVVNTTVSAIYGPGT